MFNSKYHKVTQLTDMPSVSFDRYRLYARDEESGVFEIRLNIAVRVYGYPLDIVNVDKAFKASFTNVRHLFCSNKFYNN